MKISLYLNHFITIIIILLLWPSIISSSLAQPNIVESLPGYPGQLPFSLETGYIGVGKEEQVQLFYYFVESERDVKRDPLMIWLTGGPGCSAFSGLIFEIGPIAFNISGSNSESDTPKLQQNPYSWTKVASIIFLDSPVGTGFSYATSAEAYNSSDTLQSTHIYDFLRKWLIEHPKLMKSPLYISGDSYSGKIVPIIVNEIYQGNEIGSKPPLNLKGYILGNPTTQHEIDDNEMYEYAHRISLLSDELYQAGIISCNGDFMNIDKKNTQCLRNFQAIKQVTKSMNKAHVLEHNCLYVVPIPTSRLHIKGEFCRNQHYLLAYSWADDERVREALGIREGSINHWVRCNKSLAYEHNSPNILDYHLNFSKFNLQVLVYSGDQDMNVPYEGTLQWIEELKVPISDDWRPWFVDGQVAGYVTEFSRLPYRLVFTTIKGGGHTAPEYKPRECLAMMDRWFSLSPL